MAAKPCLDKKNVVTYTELLEIIFYKVLLLNRRRPGELQRIPINTYINAEKQQNYEEFSNAVSPAEKVLMKKFKRVVIWGKRGRGAVSYTHLDVYKRQI